MKNQLKKAKELCKQNETKIVLLVGFLLVSSLSFEAGLLWGQKWQQKPLIVEKQIDVAQASETVKMTIPEASRGPSEAKPNIQNLVPNTSSCVYVGSKNSTKFYLATCSWAKRIKPENVVCFASPSEAISQGRTESKCN